MRYFTICYYFIVLVEILKNSNVKTSVVEGYSTGKGLHREKRYVAFPEGSSFTAAVCMTIGMIGNPSKSYLSWAVNWGIAYNLPTLSWAQKQYSQVYSNFTSSTAKAMIQRRSRHDLYEKLILAMNKMGYDGHSCLNRILCETGHYIQNLGKRKGTMLQEIIKTVFSFPSNMIHAHEPKEHHYYAKLFQQFNRFTINCAEQYAQCKFPLLDSMLNTFFGSDNNLNVDYEFV